MRPAAGLGAIVGALAWVSLAACGPAGSPRVAWDAPGAAASVPRVEGQGVAVGGALYVVGGFNALEATVRLDRYDPAADAWTELAPLPEKLTHAGQASDGAGIYVVGGFLGDDPGFSVASAWRYDLATDAWSGLPPLPAVRGAGAAVVVGRELHFFGGALRLASGRYVADQGEHWALALDAPADGWRPRAPLLVARNHLGAVAVDGKIYAVGGQHLGDDRRANLRTLEAYDPATDAWTALPDLPEATSHVGASTVVYDGRILVVGGMKNGERPAASIAAYDVAAARWSTPASLPAARYSPVAGVLGATLVVTGGAEVVARLAARDTWRARLGP